MQEPAEFWKLSLRQPYWEGIASWPDGCFEYRYFGGHHLLQLCLAKLSERDIAAFSEGQVHVGFYVRRIFPQPASAVML